MGALWDLAGAPQITCFGTSAELRGGLHEGRRRAARGPRPLAAALGRLDRLAAVARRLRWVYEHVGADTWLFSTSGGTDLCTAFVGGCPLLPVYLGELQARSLGAKVEAFDQDGEPLIGEVGELVITEPMPSMPLSLWNDPDGERLREPTSTCTRGSGATATGSRSPRAGRRSSTAARTRRSTAAACAWARARSTAACSALHESPTRSWSTSRARAATGCRCSSCCARAPSSTTTSWRRSAAHPRGLLAAPRARRGPGDRRGAAHAVGQGARGARQADPHGPPPEQAASRESLANPRRSTTSSSSPPVTA